MEKEKIMKTELEEAADKTLQDEINYWYEKTGSLTSEDIVRRAYSLGITTGAKWQQERMYSEKEVNEIISEAWLSCEYNEGETFTQSRKRILDTHKKKAR